MGEYTIKEIKELLVELGISQSAMAKDLFVSKDYVNGVLNERRECSSRMYTKMCTYINQKNN